MTLELGHFDQPLLIFGGPYSNLQAVMALQAVARAHTIPADHVICTGDIIAYCGQPVETTDAIREWGIHVLMGNCEESFATSADDCGCGFGDGSQCDLLSIEWFRFANERVRDDQRQWFASLPRNLMFSIAGQSIQVVHGSVTRINRFMYPSQKDNDFIKEFDRSCADILVAGHSGIPFSKKLRPSQGNQKLWHNTGAIGMPANDGSVHTWYSLFYPTKDSVRIDTRPLKYDFKTAYNTMQNVGLNNGYAACLQNGLWPSMDVLPMIEQQQQGLPIEPFITIL